MHALRDLQREFAAYLMDGEATSLLAQVADAKVAAVQCLSIHRNNVTITLREALAAVYPVVRQLLGDDFFSDVANRYLHNRPCRSGNLHDFGNEFAAALAGDQRLLPFEYLADVAALEWAYHTTFHGPDAAALEWEKLHQWTPEQFGGLHFVLHPGLSLLSSVHPVLTIWEAHQRDSLPERVDLGIGAEHVMVIRPQQEVELHRVTEVDVVFLDSLGDGVTLEQATEAAIAADEAFDLESRLTGFFAVGAIVDVHD